jgi:hypothetical protein
MQCNAIFRMLTVTPPSPHHIQIYLVCMCVYVYAILSPATVTLHWSQDAETSWVPLVFSTTLTFFPFFLALCPVCSIVFPCCYSNVSRVSAEDTSPTVILVAFVFSCFFFISQTEEDNFLIISNNQFGFFPLTFLSSMSLIYDLIFIISLFLYLF